MPERVLVVEDSPTQAEALRILLDEAGYDVATARSGEDALARMRSEPVFDVILSDIVMPGMNGYEFCRAAKAASGPQSPPVILLTTLADATDIVRGLECGADNYVTKPYDPEQLLQRIRQVLVNRELRRESAGSGAVEVRFMGEDFSISAGKEQVLDMLLSSFEELVHTTDALRRSRSELAAQHVRAEDRAERLARLQSVTEALWRAGTIAEVLQVVVATAREFLGADTAVAAMTGEGEPPEVVEVVGYERRVGEPWAGLPADVTLPLHEALRTASEVVVSSRDDLLARFTELETTSHEALLAAPLVAAGQALGAYAVTFRRPRRFDEVDRQFFRTLTRQYAQALDRARLYESERSARAEAEEANRAKAQFLASMSHDLRTPLNAIGGYVDLIDLGIRGPVTEEQRLDLARIKRSQEFLLVLINDVLNFAKLEAGSVVYDVKSISLAAVLRDVDLMLRPQMEAKGIQYTWGTCDPDVAVDVDGEKLQQVLLNLVGNALKFTPPGGSVTLACELYDERVAVLVSDSGVGIPADKLDTIFDPFVQVHRDVEESRSGIGLGLAISRELIRGMGGDLTVRSELGRGSVFTLTVPRSNARRLS
jgi:signal transduction histidine kinase